MFAIECSNPALSHGRWFPVAEHYVFPDRTDAEWAKELRDMQELEWRKDVQYRLVWKKKEKK